jgi:hypothetical protein
MEIYEYRMDVYAPASGSDARASQLPDVTGYDVEATDGHIGKVDEATNEPQSSCLVVDTGFWIFGKKRMIPAGVVQRIDANEKKVFVGMTKDQIKDAPDYDADRHAADKTGYHKEVGDYYGPHAATD